MYVYLTHSLCDVQNLIFPVFVLVVLDAAVFVTLLVIMKPLPSWAYPCVFYIQVYIHV